MKKLIIILAILLTTSTLFAQPKPDKVLHFTAGAIISTGAYLTTYYSTGSEKKATIVAIGSTILVGLGKELLDQHKYGGFDSKDLAYTIAGGIMPVMSFKVVININNKWRLKIK